MPPGASVAVQPSNGGAVDAQGEPPRRHRAPLVRRRRVAAVVLATLLLIAGLVAVNRFVFAYQPLESGGYSGWGGGGRLLTSFTDDSMAVYRYQSGEAFSYDFSFRNGGSRSATVTGFPSLGGEYYTTRTGVEVEDDPGPYRGGSPQAWAGFAPFSIDPGEERVVRFNFRFREGCKMQLPARMNPREFNGGTMVDRVNIAYEYLGVDRVAHVTLPTRVGIEAIGECPRRWPIDWIVSNRARLVVSRKGVCACLGGVQRPVG